MAIEFILDREQQVLEDELEKVMSDLKGTPEERRASFTLAQFTKRLIEASSSTLPQYKKLRPLRHIPKTSQLVKPVTKLAPQEGRDIYPIPFPGMPEPPEFKSLKISEARKLEQLEAGEAPIEISPQGIVRKPLIIDRETNQPLAEAEISKDIYKVIETPLNQQDIQVLIALENKIRKNPMKVLSQPKKLTKLTKKFCRKYSVSFTPDNYRKLRYHLIKEMINLSKIDPLFNDKEISEIHCEGLEKPIEVVYQGRRIPTNIQLKANEEINHIIVQMGKKAGQEISPKNPLLEAVISDKKVTANYGSDWAPANFKIEKAK